MKKALTLLVGILLSCQTLFAQSYLSQEALKEMLDYRVESIEELPEVFYNYFKMYNSRGNNVMARNTFFKVLDFINQVRM